jgi:hypothetical protein
MKKFIIALACILTWATSSYGVQSNILGIQECETASIYVAQLETGTSDMEAFAFGRMNGVNPEQPMIFIFIDKITGRRWAVEKFGNIRVEYTIEEFYIKYPNACSLVDTKKA